MNTDSKLPLLNVMQQMKTAAESQQWDLLQELDDMRRQLLKSDSDKIQDNIGELQLEFLRQLDLEILSIVIDHRDRKAQEFKSIQTANHAVINYRSS